MKKNLLSLWLLVATFGAIGQNLVSITFKAEYDSTNIPTILAGYGWSTSGMEINNVQRYTVTYNTIDVHGNPTVASGAVFIPVKNNCSYAPIVVYEHGTEFVESDVPSTGNYYRQGVYYATGGYIAVLPDYLGLGSNPGIHPYHHAESEATATIDLIRAVREFLDTANAIKDNKQLFITGYSHGGHSAMATNKYIQENNLQNEFNVVACAPLSGAYALNGAQFDLIFDGDSSYYASPFLPYLLGGMQEVYGNIYQNYSDIYDSPYDSNIATLLSNGNSTFYQWYVGIGGANYYNFMQDSVLNNILSDVNRDTHPINLALLNNNVYDWSPQNPLRMLYCGSDSMVSPQNAIFAADTMQKLGASMVQAINLNPNADHNGCFTPATEYARQWFDSLAQKCVFTGVEKSENLDLHIIISPSPTYDFITINGINLTDYFIKIISLDGKQIKVEIMGNKINVSSLKNGVYFISLLNKENPAGVYKTKFVKL